MDSAYLIGLDNEDGTQRQVMVIQETIGSEEGGVDLENTFKLNEGIEELGTITFNGHYTEWTYIGNLNSDDQTEIAEALQSRYKRSQQGHPEETESFSFVANVNQDDVMVQIVHENGTYKISLNREYVGDVKLQDDGLTWATVGYELDGNLVKEIGRKIEVNFIKF
ncbi:hypothetical protein IM792_19730 [Mucilaginibacter sp. JRF]|uniref:hypothetical protein n=1 Tax=Mucilaginibacter sp. JRF TaxID=2780088 RepID=UPI00188074C3|nr:hypothetical protein [Mucilaginibacter sp. JRF]MBE9586689.1 hypothetical protein [Mucilaginibacter sp. JRF]